MVHYCGPFLIYIVTVVDLVGCSKAKLQHVELGRAEAHNLVNVARLQSCLGHLQTRTLASAAQQ
jgi:hypothetical protein